MPVGLSITVGTLTVELTTADADNAWRDVLEAAALVLTVTPDNLNPTPKQKLHAILLEMASHILSITEQISVESAHRTYEQQIVNAHIARQEVQKKWLHVL